MLRHRRFLLPLMMGVLLLFVFVLTAQTQDLTVEVTLDKDEIDISKSESVTATMNAAGGVPPYRYSYNWVVYQGNIDMAMYEDYDENLSSHTFTPRFGLRGHLEATVADSAGQYARDFAYFELLNGPEPLDISIDLPATVQAGTPLTASWRITGGAPPYKVYHASWSFFEGEDQVAHEEVLQPGQAATITPKAGDRGEFLIGVEDNRGEATYITTPFTIQGAPAPMRVDLSLPDTVQAGKEVVASWVVNGGEANWTAEDARCEIHENGELISHVYAEVVGNQAIFTPGYGSRGTFCVLIIDGQGRSKFIEQDLIITGSPPPMVIDVQLPETVQIGQAVTASWTISGGLPPYTVETSQWGVHESGGGASDSHRSTVEGNTTSFTPKFGDEGNFLLGIVDASGRRQTVQRDFVITGATGQPLSMTISMPDTVKTGERITASWTVTGGQAPYTVKSVRWYVWEGSMMQDFFPEFDPSTASFVPLFGESGGIMIDLEDAEGRFFLGQAKFDIMDALVSPMVLKAVFSSKTGALGTPLVADCSIIGGTPPYVLTAQFVEWEGDAIYPGAVQADVKDLTATVVPTKGDRGAFQIKATDALGRVRQVNEWILMDNPLELTMQVGSAMVNGAERLTATWKAASSAAPISYDYARWEVYDKGETIGVFPLDEYTGTAVFNPTVGDSAAFIIRVRDAKNNARNAEKTVSFQRPVPYDFRLDLSLSSDKVALGDEIWASWQLSGGKPPYTTKDLFWLVEESEFCSRTLYPTYDIGDGKDSFVPEEGAIASFHITAVDSAGYFRRVSRNFTILQGSASLPGDANDDKTVDIMDLVSIIDYIVSGSRCESMPNADANQDKAVDLMDLVWIINKLVGG